MSAPLRTFFLVGTIFLLACSSPETPSADVSSTSRSGIPSIVPRDSWAEYPVKKQQLRPNGSISHLSVHHTGVDKFRRGGTIVGELNALLYDHAIVENWGDIAYHFLIAPDGAIYEGRDSSYASNSRTRYLAEKDWRTHPIFSKEEADAHPDQYWGQTKWISSNVTGPRPGKIQGHITVSFIGNFSENPPSPAARSAFIDLATYLMKKHDLQVSDVWNHREVASSSCPGDGVYQWLRSPENGRYAYGAGLKRLEENLNE